MNRPTLTSVLISGLGTLLFYLSSSLCAQTNPYIYGLAEEDERNRALIQIPGGTVYMAGFSTQNGQSSDFILSRKEPGRSPEIIGKHGTLDPDFAYDLCYYNHHIYMVGESQSLHETDAFFVQWDTLGNVIHSRRIGSGDGKGQMFKSISADGLGNFWIAGYHSDTVGGNGNDFWLVKADTAGNIMFETLLGSRENDYAQAVLTASDGGCWLSGDSKESGDYDVHVYRLDNQGNVKWIQKYGDAYDDGAQGLALLQNGDLLITGESVPAMNAPFDFLFIRIDSATGNPVWLRRAGGSGGDAAFEAIPGPGTDILFCGYSNSYTPGPVKIIFGKLDVAGNLVYTEDHGGSGINIGYDIIRLEDGQASIAGFSTDTLSDCFLYISNLFTSIEIGSDITDSTYKVYPNPASPGNLIQIESPEQLESIKLYSVDGKILYEQIHTETTTIRLPEALKHAQYLLHTTGKSGKTYSSWIYVHKDLE
jgi:hypothetical protein